MLCLARGEDVAAVAPERGPQFPIGRWVRQVVHRRPVRGAMFASGAEAFAGVHGRSSHTASTIARKFSGGMGGLISLELATNIPPVSRARVSRM